MHPIDHVIAAGLIGLATGIAIFQFFARRYSESFSHTACNYCENKKKRDELKREKATF